MLTPEQINNIHHLHWAEKQSVRKIARQFHLGRRTIAKYLTTPAPPPVHRDRSSKLDSFKPAIAELLEQDSTVSVALIEQRLRAQGCDGGMTIVKDYVRTLRKSTAARRAYVRMEPAPGDRFDIDWGHFGALDYAGTPRKLYAFCLVECHSRKLYVEFTHSQSFETFVRCHLHAFAAMAGMCSRALVRQSRHGRGGARWQSGSIPSALPRFRSRKWLPACLPCRSGLEKGKIERAIGYLRRNFWPLRSFTDLADVNRQVRQWLDEIANRQQHRETGQSPEERFRRGDPAIAASPQLGLSRCRGSGSQGSPLALTVTATACHRATWAANSPSKLIHLPSRFTISITRS